MDLHLKRQLRMLNVASVARRIHSNPEQLDDIKKTYLKVLRFDIKWNVLKEF